MSYHSLASSPGLYVACAASALSVACTAEKGPGIQSGDLCGLSVGHSVWQRMEPFGCYGSLQATRI